MSDSTSNLVHEVEASLSGLLIPAGYYIDVASIALTVHEYFLSFEAERRVIWGRKFSLPTILFLINRYLLWLYALSNLLWGLVDWETDKTRCRVAGYMQFIVVVIMVFNGGVFVALRIHIVNGRRWFWTCLAILLGCGSAPYDMANLVVATFWSASDVAFPVSRGCLLSRDKYSLVAWNSGAVALQATGCLGSVIVTCITWYRAGEIVLMGRRALTNTSLASLMVQSGAVYFLVDLVLNIAQIYLFVTRAASIASLTLTIESILTSRFILNLRLLHSQDGPELSSMNIEGLPTATVRAQSGRFSALDFANIGAPLDFDEEPDDEDEQFRREDGDSDI